MSQESLNELRRALTGKRVMLVTGTRSFVVSGASRSVAQFLEDGAVVASVEGPLPTVAEVDRLARQIVMEDSEEVIAIGGGMVMDSMKLACLVARTGRSCLELISGGLTPSTREIGTTAIPTTAGSGAERTPFAVVYVEGLKESVDHPAIAPDRAVLIPELSYSMPREVAASSALDAVSHSIESMWAVGSTPESRLIASGALRVMLANIERAVNRGDKEARDLLVHAASDAGSAIAISRTTAAHAMSYHLTSRHGIPHGHAVALLLPRLLLTIDGVNEDAVVDTRGAAHLRQVLEDIYQLLDTESATESAQLIHDLTVALGLAGSVDESTESRPDIEQWMAEVNLLRLSNTPVRMSRSDLEMIARSS